MDTLTHALSGALLARATAPSRPRAGAPGQGARMAAGALAAAFPDSDFVLRLYDTLAYLNWHQGVTHSLVLLPLWAWLLAALSALAARRKYRWQAFYGVALLGLAIHVAADFFTAYGTMLLAPLSGRRFSLPLAFVIDPVLSALAAIGLAAAMLPRAGRGPAVAALVLLAAYLGALGALRGRAADLGTDYAMRQGLAGAAVHALPQPLSPFNWKVIVSHGETYHVTWLSLLRTRGSAPPPPGAGWLRRVAAGYPPAAEAVWQRRGRFRASPADSAARVELAREAWRQDAFAAFRRFARFPALDRVEQDGARVCVWFQDLRFALPAVPPSFRFGLCRGGARDGWQRARRHGAFGID